MKSKFWAAIGALQALPLCAQAQQSCPQADPADPSVAVPPIVYESVVAGSPRAPQDTQLTPDKAWRAANDALAGVSAHAGHSSHAAGHDGHDRAAAPAPAAPAPAPAPADHSKHH